MIGVQPACPQNQENQDTRILRENGISLKREATRSMNLQLR